MDTILPQPQVAQPGALRTFQDGLFRVLVAAEQTNDAFALLEMYLSLGAGPPRHLHTREDETIYVLEGELSFRVGDEVLVARAGQAVFGPRQVPHQFKVVSPTARILMLLTPGRFADYFVAQSRLLDAENPVVVPQGPPPPEVLAQVVRSLREEHGVLFMP